MRGALTIESSDLQITLLPSFGGKISSLVETASGEEYLLPPASPYVKSREPQTFADSDRGGFDECLPSVSACAATATRVWAEAIHGRAEPTTADTDSLTEAVLQGSARTLKPGESHDWEMTVRVLPVCDGVENSG